MNQCLFCAIASGAEPASVIYEDDLVLVILDLFPVSDGHALVISRQHAAQIEDLSAGTSSHLMAVAERVMAAQKTLDPTIKAHNLLINDGKVANQHIPHVHLHVIPRRRGDGASTAFNWSTRLLRRFNLQARRLRLDEQAQLVRQVLEQGEAI